MTLPKICISGWSLVLNTYLDNYDFLEILSRYRSGNRVLASLGRFRLACLLKIVGGGRGEVNITRKLLGKCRKYKSSAIQSQKLIKKVLYCRNVLNFFYIIHSQRNCNSNFQNLNCTGFIKGNVMWWINLNNCQYFCTIKMPINF